MRDKFKVPFTTFALFWLVGSIGMTVNAQYLISSKAGFVNRTEGKVYILRQDLDAEKERATLATQMRDGDRLSTETGGRAEVLLNPGSYLRVDENAEVLAVDTSLNRVRFQLIKGSAIIEAGELEKQSPLEIGTPHGTLLITKKGLHRVDVRGDMTSVAVRQGEIYLGTREQLTAKMAFKIGRGKIAALNGTPTPILARLNKDAIDDFDTWSFDRAETLMTANSNALRRASNQGLLASGWIYDPFFSCYTFIPRRWDYWSPYGFGFSNNYSTCYGCYSGFNDYGNHGNNSGNNNNGNTGNAHYRTHRDHENHRGNRERLPPRAISGADCNVVRTHIENRAASAMQNSNPMTRGDHGDFGHGRSQSSPSAPSSSSSSPRSAPSSPGPTSSPSSSRGDSGRSHGGVSHGRTRNND